MKTVDASSDAKLNITIDTTTKSVDYVSGSGTKTLLFNYTVVSGDIDTDGIASTGITLSSGTIKDTAGNASVAADLTPTMPVTLTSVKVDALKPSAPTIKVTDIEGSVTGNIANNGNADSDQLLITVTFAAASPPTTEAVQVGDTVNIYNSTTLLHSEAVSTSHISSGNLSWNASGLMRDSTYSFKATIVDAADNTSDDSNIIAVLITNPPAVRETKSNNGCR